MASAAVGVDTARYLGATDARELTWSARIQSGRKEDDTEAWHARTLLSSRSELSIWNGDLLYKQFIRHVLTNVARTHFKNLHVAPSECLHIATNASSHVSNKSVHEDWDSVVR